MGRHICELVQQVAELSSTQIHFFVGIGLPQHEGAWKCLAQDGGILVFINWIIIPDQTGNPLHIAIRQMVIEIVLYQGVSGKVGLPRVGMRIFI